MFEKFPKIPRGFKNNVVITEKIDGTNAQIHIVEYTSSNVACKGQYIVAYGSNNKLVMFVGSRNRYITPADDNYGFAAWCKENAEELFKLGEGRHYGEWYGRGIGPRGYGLEERRLALFNTFRWGEHNPNTPNCCEVVPVLGKHTYDVQYIKDIMGYLSDAGSTAVPGYMNPEGIVVYQSATKSYTKETFDSPEGKWKKYE